MQTASLVVDLKSLRCSQCKMLVRDVGTDRCAHCGCVFDRVVSNHVGLAAKVQKERAAKRAEQAAAQTPPA